MTLNISFLIVFLVVYSLLNNNKIETHKFGQRTWCIERSFDNRATHQFFYFNYFELLVKIYFCL